MSWTSKNPDFAGAVEADFARQTFMKTLGANLDAVEPGGVVLTMLFDARYGQGNDYLHAGVVTTLLDNACGWAALSLAPPAYYPLTVEFKTSFMRPAAGDRLIATGRVVKPGKTLTFSAADAEMERGDARILVATMLATILVQPVPSS